MTRVGHSCFRIATLIMVAVSTSGLNLLIAQPPTVTNAADGSSSAAFWYLGGAPSVDKYFVQWQLAMQPPNNDDATPSIAWSTDRPDLVSIAPSPDGLSAILTSLGPSNTTQQSMAVYNIHITVTYDGTPSSPFPVYINTPFSMVLTATGQYCTALGACDCNASGFFPGTTGYVTRMLNSVYDILGETMAPIRLNETLEKQQWLATGWRSVGFPTAGSWPVSKWNSGTSTFNDFFWICGTPPLPSPPQTSSGNGTTVLFNETQKFWFGSTSGFTGVCANRDIVTLYTDHGTATGQQTPGIPSTICNRGNVEN